MSHVSPEKYPQAVIFFDGVCNLCQFFVRFVIPRDPHRYFRFASLQSQAALDLLVDQSKVKSSFKSVVLLEAGEIYTGSDAALRIVRRLNKGWFLLYAFIILPKPLRDALYYFVAKRRHRWFGKSSACMLPTPEHRSRFLEE